MDMKIKLLIVILWAASVIPTHTQEVYLLYDKSISQAVYAADILKGTLAGAGYSLLDQRTGYDYLISIDTDSLSLDNEAYSIIPEREIITVYGGDEEHRRDAIAHLESALDYWDNVIEITRPVYRDMPLTHYNAGSHERNDENLFHWETIRHEAANDIEIARKTQADSGQ